MSSPACAGRPLEQTSPRELRRVIAAGYIGSVVEYYDFLLYVTASSLVFNKLFFSNLSPVAGTIASLGTLAVGYIARPLGGLIFGHYGDKIGRKSVLVVTLLMMGIATTLIGILPTSDQVGTLAPVLLVALRIVQGIAVGGEWGGASLMAFEHTQPHRHGFATSFSAAGGPTGTAIAAGALGLFALLPTEQFYSWGWRIPFLLSAVLVGIGIWTRLKISESPLFLQEKRRQLEQGQTKVPLWEVLRAPRTLILAFFAMLAAFTFNSLVGSFGLTYARDSGLDVSVILGIQVLGGVCCALSMIAFGAISDRFGRRRTLGFGMVTGALLSYPFLQLIGTGDTVSTLLAYLMFYIFVNGPLFGPSGAFLSEQFETGSRYTGASLGYQAASTLGGGLVPILLASLFSAQNGGRGLVLFLLIGVGVTSACALAIGAATSHRNSTAITDNAAHEISGTVPLQKEKSG